MQKFHSEIVGMPVFTEYSPAPLALVRDIMIDPETGKLLAFVVKNERIIVPMDVQAVNAGLMIADEDRILSINEVLRVKKVAKMRIRIIGARVVTESKKEFLGRVVDYEIDTNLMILTKIHVAKTILFFRFQERIIQYRNIVRIDRRTVVVKDSKAPAAEEKAAARQAFAA